MQCHLLAVDCTLERPHPELGDSLLSPLFRRVSAVCPVLHLFGHVTLPLHPLETGRGGPTAVAPEGRTPPLSALSHNLNSGHTRQQSPRGDGGPLSQSAQTVSLLSSSARPQYSSCVHVHGVYPYFLVPQYSPDVSAAQFGAQLETVALRTLRVGKNGSGRFGGAAADTYQLRVPLHQQLLHDVEVVERVPLYGYHAHAYSFYKVSVIDPGTLCHLRDLLQDTTDVGGRTWQLYDAHSPFHAQFMVDYDIKGMTPFALPPCHVRSPTVQVLAEATAELRQLAQIRTLHADDELPRLTTAAVEVDIASADLRGLHQGTEPGEHLAHTRRVVQRYFAEHGVPDSLRVANTITTEIANHTAWCSASLPSSESAIRYGSVAALQRCDAGAELMRSAMRSFLQTRLSGATPSRAAFLVSKGSLLPPRPAVKRDSWAKFTDRRIAAAPPKTPSYVGVSPDTPADATMDRSSQAPQVPCTYQLLDHLAAPARPSLPILTWSDDDELKGSPREERDEVAAPATHADSTKDLVVDGRTPSGDSPALGGPSRMGALSRPLDSHRPDSDSTSLDEETPLLSWEDNSQDGAKISETPSVASIPVHAAPPPPPPTAWQCAGNAVVYLATAVNCRTQRHWIAAAVAITSPGERVEGQPVRLRPLIPLADTSFSADERALVRRGSWAAPGGGLQGGAYQDLGEVLLSDGPPAAGVGVPPCTGRVVDETAWDVTPVPLLLQSSYEAYRQTLQQAPAVVDEGQVPLRAVGLCRYALHDSVPLLTLVDFPHTSRPSSGGATFTSQPGPLHHPALEDASSAECIISEDEEEELFSSGYSSDVLPGSCSPYKAVPKGSLKTVASSGITWAPPALRAALVGPERNAASTADPAATATATVSLAESVSSGTPPEARPLLRTESTTRLSSEAAAAAFSSQGSVQYLGSAGPRTPHTGRGWAVQSTCGAELDGRSRRYWCQSRKDPRTGRRTVQITAGCPIPEEERADTVTPCLDLTVGGKTTSSVHRSTITVPYCTHVCNAAEERRQGQPPPPPKQRYPKDSRTELKAQPPATPTPRTVHQSVESQQLFTICALRVLYVEVLIRRREGVREVSGDELLAVGLGSTDTASDSVAVRVYTVPTPTPATFRCYPPSTTVTLEPCISEADLLQRVMQEIRRLDPEILLSWEGLKFGVGFFALRYRMVLHRSLARDLSRLEPHVHLPPLPNASVQLADASEEPRPASAAVSPPMSEGGDAGSGSSASFMEADEEAPEEETQAPPRLPAAPPTAQQYSRRFGSTLRIVGRVCRSLGQDLRKEVTLPSYTLAMAHQKLLGRPVPHFSDGCLANLFLSPAAGDRSLALSYLGIRVAASHRVARHVNYFAKSTEYSCMYGILFDEVWSRGSQFRVEASLLRMTRPQLYAMLSPSREQVRRQPRTSFVPLIMQPRSDFYQNDPVVVLDFRSLYPSVAIAYNLCYSTCLGLVQPDAKARLGVLTSYRQDQNVLQEALADTGAGAHTLTISPNGAMFVAPSIRVGVLPQLLQAILDTRFEVQAAVKHVAKPTQDAFMQQRLNGQQEALKMLANTTYGYTAASFSGRMPCVDLAEAIVSLARQTTERAIALIHAHPTWRAEVVYGDTDSVFVCLAGRSLSEAFTVGEEIAKAVTMANPAPIQLQFEKVCLPCLLLVKKRYAGYAWTRRDQVEPTFLAKGIETVRRDQCAATANLVGMLLRHLFDGDTNRDELKSVYYREVSKLQRGDVNPWNCIFRRAVRLGRYKDDTHLPLAARLALRRMEKDLSCTPYWGERLPYIVGRSITSDKLRDQVLHPETLLYMNSTVSLDTSYYIQRHINSSLDRMFYLVGISFAQWFSEMPRQQGTGLPLLDSEHFMHLQRAWIADYQPQRQLGPCKRKRSATPQRTIDVEEETALEDPLTVNDTPTPVRRHPRRDGTLTAYYPRTRCLVCEVHTVTIRDNQQRLQSRLQHRRCDRGCYSLAELATVPPICESCWSDPAQLYLRVVRRCRQVGERLHRLHLGCLRCMSGAPTDIEECLPTAVPFERATAVVQQHVRSSTAGGDQGSPTSARAEENALGCTSTECEITFEKKRLTLLWRHLLALETYLYQCVS